jgi:branched-subunit amino acid ABC-type transport system permease component
VANLGEQLLNALTLAGLLFLVSAGLSLVFGILRVVNFAHGVFYMLGAYLGYTTVAI